VKIGDLVTVNPAKAGLYLIIDEDPARESMHVVNELNAIALGKLYILYDPEAVQAIEMHEKWIEVISEGR